MLLYRLPEAPGALTDSILIGTTLVVARRPDDACASGCPNVGALACSIHHRRVSLNGSAIQGKHANARFISPELTMSRSRRKTPICGITTAASEHVDKQVWHRRYRKAVRQRLAQDADTELPHQREFFDPWQMSKDGKRYYGLSRRDEKWLRK